MKMIINWLVVLFIVAAPHTTLADGNHLLIDAESITETDEVSGFPSHQNFVTRQPGNDAILVGIGGAEVSDKPCYMRLTWTRANNSEHRTFTTEWHNDPCKGNEDTDKDYEEVKLKQRDGSVGISAINMCNSSKDHKRMKGVKITSMREITESGSVNASLNLDDNHNELLRPNCNDNWDTASSCAGEKVAQGINIYFDDEGATGLELICATPRLDQELVTGPITEPVAPGTQHKTGLTGYSGRRTTRVMIGTNVDLPNAPLRHYGITSIMMAENNDRPCQIKLFGRALDWTTSKNSRMLGQLTLDRCGSNLSTWVDILNPSLTDEGDLFVVGAEVDCNSGNKNNNRIKGLKIMGGPIDDNGSIWTVEGSDADTNQNCGDFTNKEVYCYDTHNSGKHAVAVGLEMHHEDDAFTGFALVCRDLIVDEYPALKTDSDGF